MSEIVPKDKQLDKTSKLLDDTWNSLTEGITGIAASDRSDFILSVGHFFQRIRNRSFLSALKDGWKDL